MRVSNVGFQGFWGFIEVVQPTIRGRGSWRDLRYASQFSARPVGDRDWFTGLCRLGDTLASLVRVTHNQLETIIPLSICCCSQEWRTTNLRHSQVTLKWVVQVFRRPDGVLWSATISWSHGGFHGMWLGLYKSSFWEFGILKWSHSIPTSSSCHTNNQNEELYDPDAGGIK